MPEIKSFEQFTSSDVTLNIYLLERIEQAARKGTPFGSNFAIFGSKNEDIGFFIAPLDVAHFSRTWNVFCGHGYSPIASIIIRNSNTIKRLTNLYAQQGYSPFIANIFATVCPTRLDFVSPNLRRLDRQTGTIHPVIIAGMFGNHFLMNAITPRVNVKSEMLEYLNFTGKRINQWNLLNPEKVFTSNFLTQSTIHLSPAPSMRLEQMVEEGPSYIRLALDTLHQGQLLN